MLSQKTLNNLTYLYICIPIVIFLIGWCKPFISLPLSLLLIVSIIHRFTKSKTTKQSRISIKLYIKTHHKEIIITLIIALLFVLLSGIGGYVFQNYDHIFRNAIFSELTYHNWPIYHAPQGNFNTDTIFTYYFAFWLPSTTIAKFFGAGIGYFSLYVWSTLGVLLVFGYIKKYLKSNFCIPIILFILFSGLDIIAIVLSGQNIFSIILSSSHIEWATGFQMSSFTTQLFWVFNQAIPAWLITLFIINEKDNRFLGVIFSASLLFCTLPAFGLLFILIYKIFFETLINQPKRDFRLWAHNTFTWQNLFIGIPILLINFFFLSANSSSQKISFGIAPSHIYNVILLCVLEFGLYFAICYKYITNKSLYWITFVSLLACPFITVGHSADFCMRACIPGQIIMFVFVLKTLSESIIHKDNKTLYFLISLLILGSFTPLLEISRTINHIIAGETTAETVDLSSSQDSDNFYAPTSPNIFVQYISK